MTEQDNATVNLREGKQEKFKTTIIDANNDDSTLRVLVTGASGFIGSRLVSRLTSSSIISSISNPHFLSAHQHNDGGNNKPTTKRRRQIICMTRDPKLLEDKIDNIKEKVEIVEADVMIYQAAGGSIVWNRCCFLSNTFDGRIFLKRMEEICTKR